MAHLIGNVSLSKSVYSLYDIASFEKISKERMGKLMRACLSRVISASPDKTASGIQAFFNNIAAADKMVNIFYTHSRLSPFAGAVRLTVERVYNGRNETHYAMFYIPKAVYEKYKRTGIEYNTEVSPNMGEEGLPSCSVPKRSVVLPKIALLVQFENVLKKMNIKLSDGILLAINEFMQNHSDVFGKVKSDKYDENLVRENKMSLIQAYVSPETVSAVYKVIQRYNMQNFPHIKFSDFVDSALCEKLDRTSVKYTDPELYEELIKIKQAEDDYIKEVGQNERYKGQSCSETEY